MRLTLLTQTILTMAAMALPGLVWAAPDCGEATVSMAEVTHTIKTPEQFVAPDVAVLEPVVADSPSSLIQSEPLIADPTSTPQTIVAQVAQAAEGVSMPSPAAPNLAPAVQAYADILKRRISRGDAGLNLFDYAGAKAAGELETISGYTDYLATQNPDTMSEANQIAYWANLYNALTLKIVLENYPVSSIRKIKDGIFSMGPWKRDVVTVNGAALSLDKIEHEILRKRYANPSLVHYMVNCASIGCPNLSDKIWVGATLDADREQAARDFINSPRGVAIKGSKLKASSIYDWFREDFGGSKSATLDHFRKYAGPELKTALDAGAKIEGYDYDWSLNE
ncbi:hypothetical protein GCM10011309_24180 [Litorimonas cladophorae]|uniref:DUF547 domain-containing protein n=1 Tax=Litorimonas cladophorae TaxID=1220491 RepID=A0A918NJV3_9PROT|nr:DUF547 domain-containing protein [Litorimonas cladophorae]GGX73311.1 hypothetical protein GCM10011309_24180 [Litorimonas cladophorae]